jgi:D-alanyl-D-alanine-carboxypeptidase/D-alanyl-D-alanine-endopeptidase
VRHIPAVAGLAAALALGSMLAASLGAQAAGSAGRAPWTLPDDASIRQVLTGRMRDHGVGIVAGVISREGQRVVAVGRSGGPDNPPLDAETVFQIGSVTKVFTGLLLADMSLRGEVGLEQSAASLLPAGVAMPFRGRPITLLDLSKHWSALPSMPTNFALEGQPDPYAAYTERQLYAFLSSYELPREPGRQEYSNLGVALLGHLIARRVGTGYEPLLRERILTPLGLRSTSIVLTADQRARLAPGHDRFRQPVETWELRAMPASGSLRSTANDLLRLLAFNLGLLESPLRPAMLLQRTPGRAIGWGRSMLGGEGVYGHEGGKEGYRSAVLFHPDRQIGVVVLSNTRTDESPMVIARHILYGGDPMPPLGPAPIRPTLARLAASELDAYAGAYRVDSSGTVRVLRRDDHLLVNELGGGVATFFPVGNDAFVPNTDSGTLVFGRDARGRVTTLTIDTGDSRRRATRVGDAG